MILTTLSAHTTLHFTTLQHCSFSLFHYVTIFNYEPCAFPPSQREFAKHTTFHIATLITTHTHNHQSYTMFHIHMSHIHRQQRHYYNHIHDLLPQALDYNDTNYNNANHNDTDYDDPPSRHYHDWSLLLLLCRCRIWVSTGFHVRTRCAVFFR